MNGLAAKYRPTEWCDVIGNDALIKSITTLLAKTDHPHFFLLSGERGTGKTTIARLMAKTLNIELIEEINAANDNGVDFARILDSQIAYKTFGKRKAYIVDECHRLTGDAQDILLKTVLEDTPEHAYVIFLTTNPEKLKKAVLSRATKYEINRPTRKELRERLEYIAEQEEIKIDRNVLSRIIMNSSLIPRDSIQEMGKLSGIESEDQEALITKASDKEAELIEITRGFLTMDWTGFTNKFDLFTVSADSLILFMKVYMGKVLIGKGGYYHRAYKFLEAAHTYTLGSSTPDLIRVLYKAMLEK
jgi:replication-associated recombination protein RarA